MSRTVCWFSCGAASAVATKLVLKERSDAVIAYCDTGAEHPDNQRFLRDCIQWFGGKGIRILRGHYVDTWAVWEKRRYIAGIDGAPCTTELKVGPRLEFQRPDDCHIFGYTADAADAARADRFRANYPEVTFRAPLIERGITKQACLAILENAGIKLPMLYGLGFPNNNCIPCPKATSPAYWALVRQHFPEKFERMAKLSRDLDVRLCRINGERSFIDEIPEGQTTLNATAPSCDFLCQLAEMELTA